MLVLASAIAFLPSSDLDRSRRFFADILGLTAGEVTPFACVFRAGTTMLRVTKVDDLRPQPFTVFGWRVPDLRAVVTGLTAAGVEFLRYDGMGQDADGVWTTPNGDLVAWFHDPDHNVLSLTQFVD
jgi:catechol 2,3-dioxygenase-like lactoylglutathione lyase family enzyme